MMNTWKDFFRSHILERGLDYYKTGAVTFLEQSESGYHGIVEGSEDYEVDIEMSDGRIQDMECTCPYAESGSYCKHMAAVLYAIEDGKAEKAAGTADGTERLQSARQPQNHSGSQELCDAVSGIPEDELRQLVISLAMDDDALYNRILTQYAPFGPRQMIRLKKQVDEIAYRYSDRCGFVDYRNMGGYMSALEGFLEQNVRPLLYQAHVMEAFELTNYVFHEIGNRDMDDSGGGSTMLADTCYEYWKEILDGCGEQEKHVMLQWFQTHQENYVIDYMEDYISDFLMDEFHDQEMLRAKLRQIDGRIAKAEGKTDCGNWYSSHYGQVNNLLQRLAVMEELGCTPQEIMDYRQKYRHFSAIRKLEVQEYLERQEYEQAASVLNESKELDREYPGLVAEYSRQLIDIYEKTGRREAQKAELVYQVFHCRQGNCEYVWKLKALCDEEEWKEFREKILNLRTAWQIRYELLEKEGLYQRLLREVEVSASVILMDRYEKVLKKHYPQEVRDMYAGYVKNEALRAADRSAYKELMKYLKKITRYPDGKQVAGAIALEWRRDYKRRRAMMEELGKAGF